MTTAEKDYTAVEHMVMALMFAIGKFRPYLLPKKFVILTLEENFPLVLQHMDVSARISKWLVRLQEFEYTVQVENSTRASLAGPLPRATSGKLYIIMGVDYMTRWAEATTTSRITAVEVAKFIFEHICCRFGVPLEILSDRGSGFRGYLVGELMKKLKIKRRHSTPYYPQCNGLMGKVNGMICKIITKQVVSKPKEWDKHLEAALWSYRTSFRTSLGYTPYHLVFGKEAILPIEVQLASLRVLASGRETPKEQLQKWILDLERLELDKTTAIEFYATQAKRRQQKFNEGLKDKELKRGMLVLRYDNRFNNRKDKKFLSRWEGPFLIRKKYSNGSYQLQEINGRLHKTWVNGLETQTLLPKV
ncbi:hypothetical protein L7F22_011405 [Adiantum nelumboides]|nr:hypothetical protein [Adiantum nelumboides]